MLLTRAACLLGASGVLVLTAGVPSVGAASQLSFDGTADASAQRVLAVAPGAPLADAVADGGGSRAQARTNSLGMSTSRATQPYPGDTVLQVPGLAGGLLPLPVAVPDYPFFAESSFPSRPEASASRGPLALEARSTLTTSSAVADTEEAAPGAPATSVTASVKATDDKVVAASTTSARGLVAGPLVIDGLTSSATVTRTGAGLTRSATLRAARASVAGTPVSIDDRGITVTGTTQSLAAAAPLQAALRAAGVEVRYVEEQKTPDGIVSPSLAVTTKQPVPDNPAVAVSSVTYTVVLGQASAEVAGRAFDDGGSSVVPPLPEGPAPTAAPAGDRPAPGPGAGSDVAVEAPAGAAAVDDPAVAPGPGTAPAGGTGQDAAAGPTSPAVADPAVTSPRLLTQAAREPVAWSSSFYLSLAGSALLVVLVLTLVRYVGVRTP